MYLFLMVLFWVGDTLHKQGALVNTFSVLPDFGRKVLKCFPIIIQYFIKQ